MNNTTVGLDSGNGSVSSEYADPVSKSLGFARIVVLAVAILVGFPKNLQVCYILYKRKDLRKVPHILLGNLSLVGALASGYYIPLYLTIMLMDQFFHVNSFPTVVCIARYSSSLFLLGLQTLTLVAMAIDRHDCVVRPFKRRMTVLNVRKVVKGIWLAAFLPITVHLYLTVGEAKNNCYGQRYGKKISSIYTVAFANFYIFATVIIIFATFVRIVKKLRSLPFAESNQSTEIQVTRFSYMVLFFFVASWLPVMLFVIVNFSVRSFTSPYVGGIKALILSLSNLNYVVNPFVHMNILRATRRAAGPAKPRKRDQKKETPGTAWIEERPDMTAAGAAKPRNKDQKKETPGTAWIEEQPDMAAAGPVKPRNEDQQKGLPGTAWIEEQSDMTAAGLAKPRNEDRQKETPGTAWIEEQPDMAAAGPVKPRNEDQQKGLPGTAWIEEQHDMTAEGRSSESEERRPTDGNSRNSMIEERPDMTAAGPAKPAKGTARNSMD